MDKPTYDTRKCSACGQNVLHIFRKLISMFSVEVECTCCGNKDYE